VASHIAPPAASPAETFRQLQVGSRSAHATRTTFVLAADGDRASLTETEEMIPRPLSIADADRETAWTVRSTRVYRGKRHLVGDGAVELELSTDDMQPLVLHCVNQKVPVAPAGAHRESETECGEFPATTPLEALVCSAAGQPADASDDDDRLVFAPGSGVEWAMQRESCGLGGLRRIAR
jgi:hypothetical protein